MHEYGYRNREFGFVACRQLRSLKIRWPIWSCLAASHPPKSNDRGSRQARRMIGETAPIAVRRWRGRQVAPVVLLREQGAGDSWVWRGRCPPRHHSLGFKALAHRCDRRAFAHTDDLTVQDRFGLSIGGKCGMADGWLEDKPQSVSGQSHRPSLLRGVGYSALSGQSAAKQYGRGRDRIGTIWQQRRADDRRK